jgi:hypothetical protein
LAIVTRTRVVIGPMRARMSTSAALTDAVVIIIAAPPGQSVHPHPYIYHKSRDQRDRPQAGTDHSVHPRAEQPLGSGFSKRRRGEASRSATPRSGTESINRLNGLLTLATRNCVHLGVCDPPNKTHLSYQHRFLPSERRATHLGDITLRNVIGASQQITMQVRLSGYRTCDIATRMSRQRVIG